MNGFEYKVIPAPSKGQKSPGIKGPEARFAHRLETVMNELAADGWEYQRADILPSEERQGLTSTHTVYRSVLVFRRELVDVDPEIPDAEDESENDTVASDADQTDEVDEDSGSADTSEEPDETETEQKH